MTQFAPAVEFRRLGPEDAQAFSVLRREVTQDNPVPMGLSYEEELTRTLDSFRAQLSAPLPSAVFGGFVGGELAATAAVTRVGQFPSSHHKMVMWGVFTSPRHRRKGLSGAVVEVAIRHAFNNGANRVNLQVYVPNTAAIALYQKIGFTEFGTEPEAVYLDGCYYDGVHMSLPKDRHNISFQRTASGVR
ncbi:MAG: GNAT family N-acetyltransferase [Burkholderiales bacterium]|jgi:RimJ/RimL family protein N-acetyltransferase|nr:GNAT family N-acetyltransferase [Burkholderiales bacterium]